MAHQVIFKNIEDVRIAARHFGLDKDYQSRLWNVEESKLVMLKGMNVNALKPVNSAIPVWVTFPTTKEGSLCGTKITRKEWNASPFCVSIPFYFDEAGNLKRQITVNTLEDYPYESTSVLKKRSRKIKMKMLNADQVKIVAKEQKVMQKKIEKSTEKIKKKMVAKTDPLGSLFA